MRTGRGRLPALALAGALTLAGCSTTGAPESGPGGMMQRGSGWDGRHLATQACRTPADLPGSRVQVVLADMGATGMMGGRMMLHAWPVSVPAGQVSLVAVNHGWRRHELVVLPLAPGQQAGQRIVGADGKVSESGSLGEASATCASGEGDGIRAGALSWVTLRLRPGRYELVCNLRHHYTAGMYQELDAR